MNHLNANCKSELLDECLSLASSSDDLPSDLESHLEECEVCQKELERRAADPEFWDEAATLLTSRESELNDNHSGDSPFGKDSSANAVLTPGLLDLLGPTDDPNMLGRLGEYEISGVIGVGGMGAVLKGYDRSLHRVVAIKVLAPHLAHCGSSRTRFQREARAAAAITHDNVIDIYRVADTNGIPYLVMPFARGQTLQKRIDEGGPLGPIEVLRIGRQIAAGLSAAHEQGLVHRDIKPANVLLSDGIERLVITDFGVARAIDDASMTQTGLIAGTPQYMSPEQARGEQVDCRSDLFSLGAVLYTACTGRPPFRADAAYGILRRITDTDPRPIREINAEIPDWLCTLIERLMAKHAADRFQTAQEVADVFEKCIAHLQQPTEVALPASIVHSKPHVKETKALPTQPATHSRRWSSSRVAICVAAIGILAAFSFAFLQLTAPPDISGEWQGEQWKEISIKPVKETATWYTGSIVDQEGNRGAIHLEWFRFQQRYKGRWQIGEKLAGSITLRPGKLSTLRGAVTIDNEYELESDQSSLRDFEWKRINISSSMKSKQKNSKTSGLGVDQKTLEEAARIFQAEKGRRPTLSELSKMFDSPKPINANQLKEAWIDIWGQPAKKRGGASVHAPFSGIVTSINKKVRENPVVGKGQVVVQIQTPSDEALRVLQNDLKEFEKKLAASQAKSVAYAKNVESFTVAADLARKSNSAKLDSSQSKLASSESKIKVYRDGVTKAETDHSRLEKLVEKRLASKSDLDSSTRKIDVAKYELKRAQVELDAAKNDLAALRASSQEADVLNQTKIESAKALYQDELSQMATLEKQVAGVKIKLERTKRIGVSVPNAGRVKMADGLAVGKIVQQGDVLFYLEPSSGSIPPVKNIEPRSTSRSSTTQRNQSSDPNRSKKSSNEKATPPTRVNSIGGNPLMGGSFGDLGTYFESISRIKKELRENRLNTSFVTQLRRELDTVKQLLLSKFQSAQENLDLLEKRKEMSDIRFKNGVGSSEELSRSKQAFNEAVSRVEQLKILLKFCEDEGGEKRSKSRARPAKK